MARVLALVTFKVFPPQMGGQKGVALFYRHLAKYLDVTMAATAENEAQSARNFGLDMRPLLYSNKKIYRNPGRLPALKHLVREVTADALISEHSYPAFLGWWLRKRTGKPLIIHSHNIEALRFKQMGRWWWKQYLAYERWVHRQADFNFFISEDDQHYAIRTFGLQSQKCAVITYGIEQTSLPPAADKASLKRRLGFQEKDILFLFNDTLDYAPNVQAIEGLVNRVDPILSSQLGNYKIVITGSRASEALISELRVHPHIVYKGFVDSIDPYYQAADLFLNAVANDSGVKTKVIEALAHNCTVISFAAGATGIPNEICGNKLVTAPNSDFDGFSRQIIEGIKKGQPDTPSSFYEYYNWDNIAQKAATLIHTVIDQHV